MTSSSANPRIKSIKIVSGNRTNENPNHKRIDEFFLDEETPETVPFISGITTFKVKNYYYISIYNILCFIYL